MSWTEPASYLSQYWDVLSGAAFKSAGLLALAALAEFALRRASASLRHWVWLLALCGALMLPCLSHGLPQWRVLPAPTVQQAKPELVAAPAFNFVPTISANVRAALVEVNQSPQHVDWAGWAVVAWIAGSILFVLPTLVGWLFLWRLGSRAQHVADGGWQSILEGLSTQLKISRCVRLLQCSQRSMPMTWGIWRATILLPSEAVSWPDQRKRLVLAHELAHVKRRDAMTQLIAQLARAMYWFNPLAWHGVRRLAVERERACDDIVLLMGAKASDYAEELLTVATGYQPARIAGIAAIAMARASTLESRLRAILDSCRNRNSSTRRMVWIGLIVMLVMLLPLAALRSRAAAEISASTDEQIAKLIKETRQDIDLNDYSAALEVLNQIVALDPKNDYANGVRQFVQDRAQLATQQQDREAQQRKLASGTTLPVTAASTGDLLEKVLPQTNFQGITFEDAIDYFRDTTGANIFVNKNALEAAGVSMSTPITLKLHGVKFSKALGTVLDLAGGGKELTYDIDDGVIMISTAEQLNMNVKTLVYEVGDLVRTPDGAIPPTPQLLDSLVKTIEDTVAPESWKTNGGKTGDISESRSLTQLVITQTPARQQMVKKLLDDIHQRDLLLRVIHDIREKDDLLRGIQPQSK
jgi:beta-lactamase regulating signal transducer with metallopeptidase domain